MSGAGLLFLTNLVAIVASAFLVFFLVGLNTEEVRQLMATSQKEEPLARLLAHGPAKRMLATGGQLRWRISMVLILLAAVAFPLSRALFQVASEIRARGAVQDGLKRLVPADALVSQQVTVGRSEIGIRLITTTRIPDAIVAEVRHDLRRRTGHDVQLSVVAVASKRELAELMERFTQPAPVVDTKEKTFGEMKKEILDRVGPAILEIWPSSDAPIQDFDVVLGSAGGWIDVRYQASKDLGQVPVNMVQQSFRTKLGMSDITLKTTRIRPEQATRKPRNFSGETKRP